MSLPPNPTQLDKLQLAWQRFQDAINVTLPQLRTRLAALRRRLDNNNSRGQ